MVTPDPTTEGTKGLWGRLSSEAVAGALPRRGNSPRQPPFGLYAEQINGTGFTVARDHNRRTWLYRLRPQLQRAPLGAALELEARSHSAASAPAAYDPTPCLFSPQALPPQGVDWLAGLEQIAAAGDPTMRAGVAFLNYAATKSMERAFCNHDGEMLIAPWEGRLSVQTELGWLSVDVGQLLVLPRGVRFRVTLSGATSRGFVAEVYDGPLRLPERGPVGANGLADERHFVAPRAAFEDVKGPYEVVLKRGGHYFSGHLEHSPFDVVAWHGNHLPYRYALTDFNSYGSVSWDHPDPSLLTVLTCPSPGFAGNALDVAAFVGRWDVSEDTFRPPFFHRNDAAEFNMVIRSPHSAGPYINGASSWTPNLSAHGVSAETVRAEMGRGQDSPRRLSDASVWLQFESRYALGLSRGALERRVFISHQEATAYPEGALCGADLEGENGQ